jgi:hypothetical protein
MKDDLVPNSLAPRIDKLVRSGVVEPRRIAETIYGELSRPQREAFAILGLDLIVRTRLGSIRRGSFVTTTTDDEGSVSETFNADRWARAVASDDEDRWIAYRSLTYEACLAIAAARERFAEGALNEATRLRALAAAIKKHKVATAGELPEAVLMKVLK